MTTYRVGTHHGVTINREGDGHRCDRPGHDCARGHLVAVVTNEDWELAERMAFLLNEGPTADDAIALLHYALHLRQHGERAPGGNETWAAFDRRCEAFLRGAGAQP